MHQRTLRILSADDVRQALTMAEAISAMKHAFASLSRGEPVLPARTHLDLAKRGGTALFMPSYLPSQNQLGIKAITLFDGNPAAGLPRIQSLMLLLDGSTGCPVAILDGAMLTAIRTGAASGAATDLLARRDSHVAAVFGAGVQGRTQLEAVCCVRAIREARVYDVSPPAAQRFAAEMSVQLGIAVRAAARPVEAVRGADVVCTATVSHTPVFCDEDLAAGTHVNAVGSFQPHVQEIPEETVVRATVVVDHRSSAMAEAGDLIIPWQHGRLAEGDLAELGEIVCGARPGRSRADEVTVFKSVGVGVQDLVAAGLAVRRAEQLGLGATARL